MAFLATITQQPNEKRDYDLDYSEFFPTDDVVTAADVSATPVGLTVGYAIQHPRVKVWINGGASGVTYKVTVLAYTNDGRRKEVELRVKVKEY